MSDQKSVAARLAVLAATPGLPAAIRDEISDLAGISASDVGQTDAAADAEPARFAAPTNQIAVVDAFVTHLRNAQDVASVHIDYSECSAIADAIEAYGRGNIVAIESDENMRERIKYHAGTLEHCARSARLNDDEDSAVRISEALGFLNALLSPMARSAIETRTLKNQILVDAVEFYANKANWIDTPDWDGEGSSTPKAVPVVRDEVAMCDCGDTARQALDQINYPTPFVPVASTAKV